MKAPMFSHVFPFSSITMDQINKKESFGCDRIVSRFLWILIWQTMSFTFLIYAEPVYLRERVKRVFCVQY